MNTNNKIQEVQLEITEAKQQVEMVIINVLERGDQLEDIEAKSMVLADTADMFKKQSKQLKKKMWWQNLKNILLIAFPVLCILVFIVVLLYFEFRK